MALIAALGLGAPALADAARKALKDLQGTWQATSAEEKGRPIGVTNPGDRTVITVKDATFTVQHGAGRPDQFAITLDPGKNPPHIDLRELGDGAPAGMCPAIYALDKGRLKLCLPTQFLPAAADERPAEFATGTGADRPRKGRLLFVLERAKE
jgi:uncharacterized protein (TIGR03067 family)